MWAWWWLAFGRVGNSTTPQTVAWHYSAGRWTQIILYFTAYPTGAPMTSTTSGWLTGKSGYNAAGLMLDDQGQWVSVYYGTADTTATPPVTPTP